MRNKVLKNPALKRNKNLLVLICQAPVLALAHLPLRLKLNQVLLVQVRVTADIGIEQVNMGWLATVFMLSKKLWILSTFKSKINKIINLKKLIARKKNVVKRHNSNKMKKNKKIKIKKLKLKTTKKKIKKLRIKKSKSNKITNKIPAHNNPRSLNRLARPPT